MVGGFEMGFRGSQNTQFASLDQNVVLECVGGCVNISRSLEDSIGSLNLQNLCGFCVLLNYVFLLNYPFG